MGDDSGGGGDSGGGFDFSSGLSGTGGLSGGDASASGNIEGVPLTNVSGQPDTSGSGITAQGTGLTAGIDPSSFSGTSTPSGSFDSSGSGVSQVSALNGGSTQSSGVPSSFGGSSGLTPTNVFGLDDSNFGSSSGIVPTTTNAFNSSSNPALTFGTGLTGDQSQPNAGPSSFSSAPTSMSTGASAAAPSFAAPTGVAPADISTIDPTSNAATQGTSGLPVFGADGSLQGNLTGNFGQPPQQAGSQTTDAQGNPINMSPQTSGGAAPTPAASGTSPTTPSSGLDFSQLNTPIVGNITGQQPQSGTGSSIVNSGTGSGNNTSSMSSGSSTGNLGNLGSLAGVATAAAGLGTSLLNKNNLPGQSEVNAINSTIPQLSGLINNVNQTATQLQNSTGPLSADTLQMLSYVNNGQLPPAMQAQVTEGVQSAKAAAASAMAAKGLPADPTNNPQLASQYATIDSQALALQGQLENQLYQSGLQAWQTANSTQQVAGQLENSAIQATGLDLQTYIALQSIYQNQSNQEQQSIGNLAAALGKLGGGGNNTLTIKTT